MVSFFLPAKIAEALACFPCTIPHENTIPHAGQMAALMGTMIMIIIASVIWVVVAVMVTNIYHALILC